MGIGAGARMVANGAGIRGAAGLNATVWIENRTGEIGVNDLDGAYEVWMDIKVHSGNIFEIVYKTLKNFELSSDTFMLATVMGTDPDR